MGLRCGIVGLPNAGKSSLFNALTASSHAEVAPFAFSTREPHLGEVIIPDHRLERIASIAAPEQIIPARLPLIDIAGLIRGAASGEGLGNQFLSHIREVEVIIHVLRCFENDGVAHVEGSLDPVRDALIVELELTLADLEIMERQCDRQRDRKRKLRHDNVLGHQLSEELMERLLLALREGRTVSSLPECSLAAQLNLLTAKPTLYVCNVSERAIDGNSHTEALASWAAARQSPVVVISAAAEAELSQLAPEESDDYRVALGLKNSAIKQVVHHAAELVSHLTFFTVNAKRAQAWLLERRAGALEAAGKVHSDFAVGFIRAETISYQDFVTLGGAKACSEAGRLRLEGRDYQVQDGDIMQFRFRKTA